MDSFEVNKIIAAVLVTVLLVFGIGKISDIIFHVEKPNVQGYKVEIKVDNSAGQAKAESQIDISALLALGDVDSGKTIELAQETQKIEREIDIKYRKMSITALNEISDTKELLLMKDVIEAIEEMADKCQEVSDSFILLALSL